MANWKALLPIGVAALIGVMSPFLPKFAGQPVVAMAAAAIGALITPAKNKGQIILFLFVWAIFFTLMAAILGGL